MKAARTVGFYTPLGETGGGERPAPGGGGRAVQAAADGRLRAAEGVLIALELPQRVGQRADGVELEGELLKVGAGLELAAARRDLGVVHDRPHPASLLRGNGVADGTRAGVELVVGVGEEAAPAEHAVAEVAQPG